MRSELHRNHVTDAQTTHDNLRSDMLASLEVVLHWLGSAVLVAFIGLAIIEPERVERTLTPLMLKAPNIQIVNASDISFLRVKLEAELADEIELGSEVRWSAVEMAKSDDRIKQIDAEHEFKVIDSPPQVTDDFDQRSQSQTDTTGSAPIPTSSADTTGSAPIPTSSAAGSIDIDQSLAIEFPTAAYEPHKSADAMKRHPLRRAKVAAKRSVSNITPRRYSKICWANPVQGCLP